MKLHWQKNKDAPISEYYCNEIVARIYQRTWDKCWVLVCWEGVNPIGKISFFRLKDAKQYLSNWHKNKSTK